MEELGLAGHPNELGSMAMTYTMQPNSHTLRVATQHAILVANASDKVITFDIPGQILTSTATELSTIANPPLADMEYVKSIARLLLDSLRGRYPEVVDAKLLTVSVGTVGPEKDRQRTFQMTEEITSP
jgi:hypothetical protein